MIITSDYSRCARFVGSTLALACDAVRGSNIIYKNLPVTGFTPVLFEFKVQCFDHFLNFFLIHVRHR